ncbi:MAG: hypothetical protein ACYDHW_16840 [Syntrophorhabdaceae bacterium]
MALKTARVTFLTSPDFKTWLGKEADKVGISISELIRIRCQGKLNEEELMLSTTINELRTATVRASAALDKGLKDAETVLSELRTAREGRLSSRGKMKRNTHN